jgi:putative ABC transport system permease protein
MSRPSIPLPLSILRLSLPRAERDEIVADIRAEFEALAQRDGAPAATRWLWGQALRSLPGLLTLNWRRASTGFEPRANAFSPGGNLMQHWIADARYAARRLRTRPAYTLLAVLTLALGIGGTAAVFGIARPIMLDPLPYANAKQVASFWASGWWNEEEYTFLRGNFPGFRSVAMYREGDMTMRDGDSPARLIAGIQVSHELFDVLGVRPMLGRGFRTGDDVPGADPTVVISHGLWQDLGGTQDIVGKRYDLDGVSRTVIGVMPKGFWYPNPSVRLWSARPINPAGRNGSYTFVGLVAPGNDPANMTAHVDRLTKMLGERFQYGERGDKTKDAWVKPLREELLGSMKPAVLATFAAMALILLIACVNVAALMLGQVEGRASELAVRSALGATHSRITQQLAVEALLLGVIAGVVGGTLAMLGFPTLAQALPIGAWREAATFDWTVFAAALGVSILAVLAVVLVPASSLWRGGLRGAISGARTGGIQGRGGRLEQSLVVAEVALAMLVASGAALLVRSVSNLYAISPGVDPRGVAVVDMVSNRNLDGDVRIATIDRVITALQQLPGVQSVGAAMKIPLRGGGDSWSVYADGEARTPENAKFTYFRIVSQDYFDAMGIKVRSGRLFDGSDRAILGSDTTIEMSVVVNEAFAKKLYPEGEAVGRSFGGGFGIRQRIVGIVPDVSEASLTDKPEPVSYYVHRQGWWGQAGSLVIKTTRPGDAEAVLDDARRTVQRVAPEFAVRGVTTMERIFDNAVGPARQLMALLGMLAGLALLLGAIGIYGVIAHFAARRQRDWAIRVALGLPGSRVVTHIVRQGLVLATVGVVFGAIGAALLTRLLSSFLYGVSSVDPVAFAGATAALLAIGAAAAFLPAWRAGTVDPAIVLREQ